MFKRENPGLQIKKRGVIPPIGLAINISTDFFRLFKNFLGEVVGGRSEHFKKRRVPKASGREKAREQGGSEIKYRR